MKLKIFSILYEESSNGKLETNTKTPKRKKNRDKMKKLTQN